MNKFYALIIAALSSTAVSAQVTASVDPWRSAASGDAPAPGHASNQVAQPVKVRTRNFATLTAPVVRKSAEAIAMNKGHEHDPELGILVATAPCDDCFEMLDKRTAHQKYFVKEGTGGKQVILQSGEAPLHYKDAKGNWRSVNHQLTRSQTGIYTTTGRVAEVKVNTRDGFTQLNGANGSMTWNRNLELVFQAADGTQHLLGKANWGNYSVGDDGMKVMNAWPGIDMEMAILPNGAKTNFIINGAMPGYAGGKLLVRDHVVPGKGLRFRNAAPHAAASLELADKAGNSIYTIGKAIAYQSADPATTTRDLFYTVSGNTLDIEVPGDLLNQPATAYPLVIDPTVSNSVSGPSFEDFTSPSCSVTNYVSIPAGFSISSIGTTWGYYGAAGQSFSSSDVMFTLSTLCYTNWAHCTGTGTGIPGVVCPVTGSITGSSCMPPVSCSATTLPVTIRARQSAGYTAGCGSSYFASANPYVVNVTGTFASSPAITPTGSAVVCAGSNVTLSATPSGGTWSTSASGVATVSATGVVHGVAAGTANITYTAGSCSFTDVVAVTVQSPVTVNTISGTVSRVCVGNTITLANTSVGGSWSSANPSIATVSGGTVTGVAGGTATISYTMSNSCNTVAATRVITVNALPVVAPVTGASLLCMPGTITLASATTGGTWSSSSSAVATISSGGVVAGVSPGTTSVSYAVSNTFCTAYASTTVTVGITPTVSAITGASVVCQGGLSTLSATGGGSWSSASPAIASVGTGGVVTGLSGGTATISYTNANICGTASSSRVVTVNPLFAAAGVITTVAGNGTTLYVGDGVPATSTGVPAPMGVTADTAGNIYFVDLTIGSSVYNRVRKVSTAGIISTIATTTDYLADLAFDKFGNLYISGQSGSVYKINSAGLSSTFVTGLGTNSQGICTDSSANVYVAVDGYVKKITPAGVVSIYAGTGAAGFTTDSGAATSEGIGIARGVAVDAQQNLYIASQDYASTYAFKIFKVTPAGTLTRYAGTGVWGTGMGDGGPATAAEVSYVYDLAIDNNGDLIFPDQGFSRLRKIFHGSGFITSVAGSGTATPPFNGDNIAPLTANMTPGAACTDKFGNLYISDVPAARIRKILNDAGIIQGSGLVCVGASSLLTDTTGSGFGTWSSSNTAVATVGSTSGIVSGVATGTAVITYRLTGCNTLFSTKTVTVNPLPVAGAISGVSSVCTGKQVTLSASVAGGSWSSSSSSVATVNLAGMVTGVSPGTITISYTVTNSCGSAAAATSFVVDPTPYAGVIGGQHKMCPDSLLQLTETNPGGVWSTSTPGVATVSSLGQVVGLTTGTATITYTVTQGACSSFTTFVVTVDPCSYLGIGTTAGVDAIAVQPNPNNGRFTVTLNGIDASVLTLTNLVGQKVAEYVVKSGTPQDLVIDQPSGIYFLNAVTSSGTRSVKVVISR